MSLSGTKSFWNFTEVVPKAIKFVEYTCVHFYGLIEEIVTCYFLFLLTNTKEKDKQKLIYIYIDLLDHL